jgi:hypothetical protein
MKNIAMQMNIYPNTSYLWSKQYFYVLHQNLCFQWPAVICNHADIPDSLISFTFTSLQQPTLKKTVWMWVHGMNPRLEISGAYYEQSYSNWSLHCFQKSLNQSILLFQLGSLFLHNLFTRSQLPDLRYSDNSIHFFIKPNSIWNAGKCLAQLNCHVWCFLN